jgi:hypothetical protein
MPGLVLSSREPGIQAEVEAARSFRPAQASSPEWVEGTGIRFLQNNPMLLHRMMKNIIYYCRYTRRYTHLIGIVWHGMARRKQGRRKQGVAENRVA